MASVRPIRAPGSMRGWAHRLALVVLTVSAPALAVACVSGDVPAVPADDAGLVLGQTIYNGNCAPCHGPTGGGGVGLKLNGGSLIERIPDVADQRAIVVDGRDRMPGFGAKLSDEEIDAVVRYTREIIAEQ